MLLQHLAPRAWNNGDLNTLLVVSVDEIAPPDAYGRLSEPGNTIPGANREKLQPLRIVSVGKVASLHNVGDLPGFTSVHRTYAAHAGENQHRGDPVDRAKKALRNTVTF